MLRLISLLALVAGTSAWTTGSAVSGFHGAVLVLQQQSASAPPKVSDMTMKKGKDNVPPQMRAQYAKQKEMSAMREQMENASKPGPDGFPVFSLFVRTKRANMWYPCGSFKGDERSAALAKSYANGGLLAGISKKQLDGGISGSLYKDQERLKGTIGRAYPQLRKSSGEFEFGYKLGYEGLSEEQTNEINFIEPKEQKGVFDNFKNMFS